MPHPTFEEVLATFDYHKPDEAQIRRIGDIRLGAKLFAMCINNNVKDGPDKTVTLRKVHEAMMTANKAIVCEGPDGTV